MNYLSGVERNGIRCGSYATNATQQSCVSTVDAMTDGWNMREGSWMTLNPGKLGKV